MCFHCYQHASTDAVNSCHSKQVSTANMSTVEHASAMRNALTNYFIVLLLWVHYFACVFSTSSWKLSCQCIQQYVITGLQLVVSLLSTDCCTRAQTPFGLTAVSDQKLYVSDWDKNAVFEVDVSVNPAAVRQVIRDVSLPMAVQYSAVSGLFCLCSRSSYSQQCYFRHIAATVHWNNTHTTCTQVVVYPWHCCRLIDSSRPRPHGLDATPPHGTRPRPPNVTQRIFEPVRERGGQSHFWPIWSYCDF